MEQEFQVAQLTTAGADGAEVEELLCYNENRFDLSAIETEPVVPLPDEPFVACWAAWLEESRDGDAFAVLSKYLPQLRFPIGEGISRSQPYRSAVLRGVPVEALPEATGLEIERPELVELDLYPSFAGRVPVLTVRGRREFVTLVQALAKKNEPVVVPDAQGAVTIAGFPNWERIRELRRRWEAQDPAARSTGSWNEEFARIRQHRELYQDRFIVLSDGPYSAVAAAELGLAEPEWRKISLVIRREHECAHYFTRRLYGSMSNHLLDELIADYTGIATARGRFRADWFLRFIGLEDFPRYRCGARLDIYRGDPPLSDGAFKVLHTLVKAAAENLERFDARWPTGERSLADRALMIRALASLRLEEIASPEACALVERALEG
ncbi:MAG: hypothetical protein GY856_45580 [bacterium]|nr:hypothetical protein [bacterium]